MLIPTEDPYQQSFIERHRHFIECLEKGIKAGTEGGDYLHTSALVSAGYESTKINQVVYLKYLSGQTMRGGDGLLKIFKI